MNFIDKQIKPSVKVVTLDTNDNIEVFAQLPTTMVKVLNIKDMGVKDGKFVKRITFTRYSNISYDELVNGMVRDKYSESQEFAILRKAMTLKTDEFTEYNAYVEECKVKAKEWINNRDGI
jgi:hypothetical protein